MGAELSSAYHGIWLPLFDEAYILKVLFQASRFPVLNKNETFACLEKLINNNGLRVVVAPFLPL